ncbi:hypothetical protein QBC38DRAFT_485140 [Podospora fimiseda]|uniref:Secreted protein n=1 Tax=Podospora fimiseda TaxID=252190 RepID=A0AAN7GQH9_9PEZI|nr:hypothetical protein QBC38DRAFT_485140 [Podospora fimiseda]
MISPVNSISYLLFVFFLLSHTRLACAIVLRCDVFAVAWRVSTSPSESLGNIRTTLPWIDSHTSLRFCCFLFIETLYQRPRLCPSSSNPQAVLVVTAKTACPRSEQTPVVFGDAVLNHTTFLTPTQTPQGPNAPLF